MGKMFNVVVSLSLVIVVVLSSLSITFAADRGTIDEFTNETRWKDGVYYKTKYTAGNPNDMAQVPYLWPGTGIVPCRGCRAYVYDFVAYVYGIYGNPGSTGTSYGQNTSEIRRGDVIYTPATGSYSEHWFVVLERNGNTLRTAEAAGNRVYISSSHYSISNDKIYFAWDGKINRSFTGYHFSGGNTTPTVSVTTTSAQSVTETNAVIYGSVSYSGTRPSECGVYFGSSPNSMNIVGKDTINHNKNPFDMWYNLNGKGITLSPGTTYYWQCYAIVSGVMYKGEVKSFTTPGHSDPIGSFDGIEAAGYNAVHVTGWAYDPNEPAKQLNMQVYIGDSKSIELKNKDINGNDIVANTYRQDVDDAYHCGAWHGFDVIVPTSKSGEIYVDIYAIDSTSGMIKRLGSLKVNLISDTGVPVISDVHATNITSDGYTVYCAVSDNDRIQRITFPTWTTRVENGTDQDDIIWHDYSNDLNSNFATAWFRVKTGEHKNEHGYYRTHIYAYDYSGNVTSYSVPDVYVPEYSDYFPTSIFEYNGNIYAMYDNALTWTEANELCKSMGGHLVTITSQAENDEITKHITPGVYYWTGLNDAENEGHYVWSNGEAFVYDSWNDGEPNDWDGVEEYIQILGGGKWNDNSNDPWNRGQLNQQGFILEIEGSSIKLNSTQYFENDKYEFYGNLMPYSVAKFYAESKGGHLVTIESAEENELVRSNFGDWYMWTDLVKEGSNFLWENGDIFGYDNWNTEEPNNYQGIETKTVMESGSGKWNDTSDKFGAYYCIEYDNAAAKFDVTSENAKNITFNNATLVGSVKYYSKKPTEYGFQISTSMPDDSTVMYLAYAKELEEITHVYIGDENPINFEMSFESYLLQPSTIYYWRACAMVDGKRHYSETRVFRTKEQPTASGKIQILQMPNKMIYRIGEKLDLTGGRISGNGIDINGEKWEFLSKEMSNCAVNTDFNSSKAGTYTVTISEMGYSVSFNVQVEASVSGSTYIYGDVNCDGKVAADDATFVLQKSLVGTYRLPIESETDNWLKYADVSADRKIAADDATFILQKALVNTYLMPAESK